MFKQKQLFDLQLEKTTDRWTTSDTVIKKCSYVNVHKKSDNNNIWNINVFDIFKTKMHF